MRIVRKVMIFGFVWCFRFAKRSEAPPGAKRQLGVVCDSAFCVCASTEGAVMAMLCNSTPTTTTKNTHTKFTDTEKKMTAERREAEQAKRREVRKNSKLES